VTWSRWYATKSYMMSTLWLSPLIACVLAQLTYRVPYVLGVDLGAIPGFIYTEQGQISALDINITMNLTFIVFTFASMLVAIQIASAQLSPRIIATALLRDNVIRIVVALFAYGLVISLGARNRTETSGFRHQHRCPLGPHLRCRLLRRNVASYSSVPKLP
jgi:uncharacterized membrane protein